MRTLLLLPLLLTPGPSPQDPVVRESCPVVVMSFKWFKDRQPAENAVAGPQPAMTDANKNYERQRRINSPAGERDPNADTLDNRSNELEKIVQESRRAQPIDGFIYQIKLHNGSAAPVLTIFWEYQFIELANPKNVMRRRFDCSVKINPGKDKDLQVFSLLGPSNVINVKSLSKGSGDQFQESVVIDRVEYADDSFWQRKDWQFDRVKATAKVRSDRGVPPCRSF